MSVIVCMQIAGTAPLVSGSHGVDKKKKKLKKSLHAALHYTHGSFLSGRWAIILHMHILLYNVPQSHKLSYGQMTTEEHTTDDIH